MIRVEQLSLYHGIRPLLQDITFEIHPGQTLAVIGEPGGGKTSLAHVLMGLTHGYRLKDGQVPVPKNNFSWTGEAWLGQLNVLRANKHQLQAMRGHSSGMIVQALADALNPHLTVLQHVQELLHVHGIYRRDARDVCAKGNIPERLLHRYPAALSGGEIQRVLTTLALVNDPEFLILDEPTTALDMVNREIALRAFQNGSERRCQMLITHDIDLARRLATHAAVLRQGRLTEIGTAEEVLEQPRSLYTQQLLKLRRASNKPRPFPKDNSIQDPILEAKVGNGLTINCISHEIQGTPLLSDVSAFVPAGRCMAVLGPSGSGKTTLAHLLTGYEKIQDGFVYWGTDVARTRPLATLIPQHPHRAMACHFSVAEVLQEALMLTDGDMADLTKLLERVGLPTESDFLKRKTANLSGGEAQRLVIARALATRPNCLVADEPTSALDMQARSQVLEILRGAMRNRNVALVLFTHDLDVTRALADKICHLEQGQLVCNQTPLTNAAS
ncbi:ATP-binding cassette domain-containing protein [Pseudovibrio sp. Tun.PSC04-5.I4]|uniref:ABC transporter ATP-binding protein n=1 Tax=Pseudovibrio sp. Tun.PSC04-5.I4 TaxID=1798213 RepID=UPI00088F6375|nr:ATP-binding cassette domain-containing protein [Pseudovibrio sp. Tun.PSC04-5.I4]SDQ33670.1 peptide/nickel transport system ATP-binding protein [Pseudovibrio sp. Tun.PSC04-5.I4]